MPAFIAHFLVVQSAAQRARSRHAQLWRVLSEAKPTYRPPGGAHPRLSQLAFWGSVGPDLPAYDKKGLGDLFDLLHHKRTGAMVMNLLDQVRAASGRDRDARLAFTLGYISHIAADIICHPYVNNFAGACGHYKIPKVFKAIMAGNVAMHMFSEVHQDTYLGMRHYGCGNELSNGPGDTFWGKSWSDFLNDLVSAGIGSWGHNPRGVARSVMSAYHAALGKTFPETSVSRGHLEDALGNMFDALDLGYDMAVGPPVDKYVRDFVEHKFYRDAGRRYEDVLFASAEVAAGTFWPAAWTYLNSGGSPSDRRAFLKVMGNYNLDTGYTVRVYSVGDTIHVRYEHSWAQFLS